MAKWILLGALLVVGVLAVVMVAAVPAVKPDQGGSGPQLFTLLDNVAVPVGNPLAVPIESEYVDVSKFPNLRVFTRVSSDPSVGGEIRVRFTESVDGVVDAVHNGGMVEDFDPDVSNFSSPPFDETHQFFQNMPRQYIIVVITDNTSPDEHTLSVFLHAAP